MVEPAAYLPADERRAATVDTVLALAAESNPGEITTAAIAKRMNVTQGALFRHFPSKEAIWQSVMEWVADRLDARLERAAAAAPTPLAALRGMFLQHVAFVAEHPGVPRMMFGELQRAAPTPAKRVAAAMLGRYGERVRVLLEQAQAQGEVADDVDTQAAAVLFIGMIQGLVMQSLLAGEPARLTTQAPALFVLYERSLRRQP
ncbi:MAG: TetR/AcrR family transcriptional regulator [Thermomonas sp.]|nr:TetR/AcrR family transcriptional regulator [Thermomonas sp.]